MPKTVLRTGITVERFLPWNLSLGTRYELSGGVPVPSRCIPAAGDEQRLQIRAQREPDLMHVIVYARDTSGSWNNTRFDQPVDCITIAAPRFGTPCRQLRRRFRRPNVEARGF